MTIFSSLYTTHLDEELGTDDSTTLFNTARRKSAINRGVQEFAELTECLPRWSTMTITGGTAEYDLNLTANVAGGDFLRLAKTPVEFHYVDASSNLTILSGPDSLPLRDVTWMDEQIPGWRLSTVASTVSQMPSLYYERLDGGAHYLGFWPPPSTGSSASAKSLIPYIARPAILTSDTDVPFTIGGAIRQDLLPWHQAFVHFGAYQLEKLRRDEQASQAQLQIFLGYVTRYTQNTRRKGGQMIRSVRNYFIRHRDTGVDPRI